MNYTKVLILTCLFASSMCFLRKKKGTTLKVNAKQELQDVQGYINEIFQSIADYKFNTKQMLVQQSSALFYLGIILSVHFSYYFQAQQEVFGILQNEDFGTHQRFPDWVKLAPNDYFTEITLKVHIEQLPEPKEFAESVLQAILEEQPFYLSHEEDFAGVAMEQGIPNEYILVIQLLKKPDYYQSCKEQLFFEEQNREITIMSNGNLFDVKCDVETDDGGWTLIHDNSETQEQNGTVDIDDIGLEYTELLWKAKNNYAMDYNKD